MRQRKPKTIVSRISSVTNGFVQAILPPSLPDDADRDRVLEILAIDAEKMTCAYCGARSQHWDHLNPFVRNKRPSGFLHESKNLVPACGPCNTSKGGTNWREWMLGSADGSPTSRNVPDTAERVLRLERLEEIMDLQPVDFADMVDQSLWQRYWRQLDQIEMLMRAAQADAKVIREEIAIGLKRDP